MKIWLDWFTRPEHMGLGDRALLHGLAIVMLANHFGRQPDGSGLVLGPDGEPMGMEAIARYAQTNSAALKESLTKLVAVGTLEWSGSTIRVPNLQHTQEDPSAFRKRRARKLKALPGGVA